MTQRSVRSRLGQVARELNTQVDERAHELETIFLARIPEVNGDEAIQELMVASTAANLSVMFDALVHGIEVGSIEVPAAAAAYAQRFAQRGLPVEAVLRAYRLGEHRFIQWFVRELAPLSETTDELQAAVDEVVEFTARYIDRISEALLEIYAEEQRLWSQRTGAARAAQVRAVLDDDTMDENTAELMTGLAMRQCHVALVVWADGDQPHMERTMIGASEALRRGAEGTSRLVVQADAHTLWAWLSAPELPPDLDGLLTEVLACAEVDIAVGERAHGMEGFRSSHREALRARAVAQIALGETRVTRFGEVRLPAMLADDLHDLRTWVVRTLGDLAIDDEDTERLRTTARTYFECHGNMTETAEQLHIHRNTVRYRLQRAEEIRGRSLSDDRLDLEVALLVCARLDGAVLLSPHV